MTRFERRLKGRVLHFGVVMFIVFVLQIKVTAELWPVSSASGPIKRSSPFLQQSDAEFERLISKKIDHLLQQMTIEEKVGQMTQVTLDVLIDPTTLKDHEPQLDSAKLQQVLLEDHVGSILNVAGDKAHSVEYWHQLIDRIQRVALSSRLQIPVLYGVDSIHGAHYTSGATLFPQSLAIASTWNKDHAFTVGAITALETKLSGIPWNFFPVLDVGRQPLWSRVFETYGEDSLLAEEMGSANIIGQQGQTKREMAAPNHALACMKHYVGYSYPWSGKDRTPAIITERMLREIFLPPFQRAVEAGAETVMINSAEIDGTPGHINHRLITEILKGEMVFKGFVVSDWEDIKRLYTRDHLAASYEEAVEKAVMAGVDMSMVPFDTQFASLLTRLVKRQRVPISRIDDAVRRILRVKFLAGIFDNPFPTKKDLDKLGSESHRQQSEKMAADSIILLKNEKSILPLQNAKIQKITAIGPACDSLSMLNGGWTITWQGGREELYPQNRDTISKALEKEFGPDRFQSFRGVNLNNEKELDYKRALIRAKTSDLIILCLGEKSYTETPGNINDLDLDSAQVDLAKEVYQLGRPVVLILLEGRPRVVREIVDGAQGILLSFLPGMEAAKPFVDVLMGRTNPSGRLPITYPRYSNSLLSYDHKWQEIGEGNTFFPQWPFGYGLSYSTFEYSNLKIVENLEREARGFDIEVTVTNRGPLAGAEIIPVYVSDLYRSVSTPPVKKLVGFDKIDLEPQQSKFVRIHVPIERLSFVMPNLQRVVETGEFLFQVNELGEVVPLQ